MLRACCVRKRLQLLAVCVTAFSGSGLLGMLRSLACHGCIEVSTSCVATLVMGGPDALMTSSAVA